MKILEKMKKKQIEMQQKVQKGRMISEQERAERIRKKKKQIKDMKPGAVKTIREGLMYRKSVLQVMKEEYDRRFPKK